MDDQHWADGAKGAGKKEAAEAKKADAARKKAERDALLAEESKELPSKPKKTPKAAATKNVSAKGIDSALTSLNASNIDDALDALSLTNKSAGQAAGDLDRHPERRFKAALMAYEEVRLPELKQEHKGLRLNQYKDLVFKEFQKSDKNPMNHVSGIY